MGNERNQTDGTDQMLETTIFIRKIYSDLFDPKVAKKVPVLYGGSVIFKMQSLWCSMQQSWSDFLLAVKMFNITGFFESRIVIRYNISLI